VHPNDIFDIIGFLLVIALVAVVLTKKNTSSDIGAAGSAFTGSLKQAEAG
jgi:preprotein translocase subunit SecG